MAKVKKRGCVRHLLRDEVQPHEFAHGIHQMGAYLNTTESRFVHLVQLLDDNCVEPYFIESEQADCYLNVSRMEKLRESEVTVLSKEEYDQLS